MGFSLLEALIATTIVAVAAGGLLQLFVISASANRSSHTETVATLLAQEKIEQLRALDWSVDAAGISISDTSTNTAVSPDEPGTGTGLATSPPRALNTNTAGYCDFVDAYGQLLGGGSACGGPGAPSGAAYVRRWSITPLPGAPQNVIVLQVNVSTVAGGLETRLASMKARKSQ
jgi:type II secretory pathway pseudopilin PulG